jgi:FkbM family methyltransferase
MNEVNILDLIKERILIFFYLMKEGYKLRDKIIILEYHLRWPLQLLNYLAGKKNLRNLKGNVYIKNKYGIFFCGNNFSNVFGAGSFCEPEIRKEFFIEKGVAIDVGSNIGMFTIFLAKSLNGNGKVVSIEIEKNNLKLLKKNVKLNNLGNVFVVGKGAYSKRGIMELFLDEFGTGGHSLLKKEGAKKEVIEVDTLDNIIKELGVNRVDVIKIDVEGAELDVLNGAKGILQRGHPKIIFEALDDNKRRNIENFLMAYDYKVRKIGDWNFIAERL